MFNFNGIEVKGYNRNFLPIISYVDYYIKNKRLILKDDVKVKLINNVRCYANQLKKTQDKNRCKVTMIDNCICIDIRELDYIITRLDEFIEKNGLKVSKKIPANITPKILSKTPIDFTGIRNIK